METQGIHHCPVVMRPCLTSALDHLSTKRTLLKYTWRHICNPIILYVSINTTFIIYEFYLVFISVLFHYSSSY